MCQRATVHPRAKNPAIGVLASDEVPSTTHGVQNQPANAHVRWQTTNHHESTHESITAIKTIVTNLEKLQARGMPYLRGPMKCLFVPCQLMKNFGKATATFVHSQEKTWGHVSFLCEQSFDSRELLATCFMFSIHASNFHPRLIYC